MLEHTSKVISKELDQELEKLEQLVQREEWENEQIKKSILEKELFLKKLEQYGCYIKN